MLLADQVRSMGHGDHVCLVYDSFAEQLRTLIPFLRDGLERGERCLYIADGPTAARVRGALGAAGLAGRPGAVEVLTPADAYLAGGVFQPGAMLDLLRRLEAGAMASGFTGLRVTGEMTWALGPEPGCERLMEYEAGLNRYIPGSHTLAICQYDRLRFPAEVIEQVLETHPVAVVGDRVMRNPYYRPPATVSGPATAGERLEWMLDHLRRADASEARQEEARRRSEALIAAQKRSLELVVTGAPLRDVLRQLATTVEEQAGGSAVASILLLDAEGRLHDGASPSLPDNYLRAIDGLPADPALGTCCAAAALGAPVVTPDFATAPGWKGLAHLPLGLGFRGAWSMPILARDGRLLGTFGTYFRECREPTGVEREVVSVLARTASIAIERGRDEAARRAAEEALRRAKDAAESASQAKSQFLAVVSHELRTPLTGIIGYADLLGSDIWGPTTEEQRTQIARIKAGAWHLVTIIEEILTFARVEAGKEGPVLGRVDVARCVRESAELLAPQAVAKGIALRVSGCDRAMEIVTDAGKLRQIVLNLTGNAVKFTDAGSVELGVEAQPGAVVVRVRDSGPGIPAAQLERIFEPFVQVDQSNTRIKGGTGLGLSVCRSLAQLLGGAIVVEESAPGIGSTFALRLPGDPPRAEGIPAPAAAAG